MKYISTHSRIEPVSFKDAVISGLPTDGGLYVPQEIPSLDPAWIKKLLAGKKEEIAYALLHPFVEEDITNMQLVEIVSHAINFEMPLIRIGTSNIYALELFHGPTWAFKDVGARFLAGCLSTWANVESETTILVATSGDTGGAVANGFYRQKGTSVVILYPHEKISPLQEQQIAGLGDNIYSFAVKGTFDDCQRLVKAAFSDKELRKNISLTSANSINIARWLPQMIFYALASKEINDKSIAPVICVPSGNYGNITAGILLQCMGIKFDRFIAAHNANDTIPRFLKEKKYAPHDTIPTLANAMDVSDPSNFVRLKYLWEKDQKANAGTFTARSIPDEKILSGIKECWDEHRYLLDPHTATAWQALRENGAEGVILSTAHPQKFEEVIDKGIGFFPDEWKKTIDPGVVDRTIIEPDYNVLKDFLKSR